MHGAAPNPPNPTPPQQQQHTLTHTRAIRFFSNTYTLRHVPGSLYKHKFGPDLDSATNELVIRIQPKESIYLKINNKASPREGEPERGGGAFQNPKQRGRGAGAGGSCWVLLHFTP